MAAPPLHAQLAALADPCLTDAERLHAIRLLEDLKAHACAIQARLSVDLDDSVRAQHADLRLPAREQGRGVASMVALARRESPARGARFLGLARTLTELTHTLAAMDTGPLSEWRATLIARETACLSAADRALVDEHLCAPLPDGTYRFDGWGDRRLVAETQKLAYALDPHAVVNRRAKAETERRVSLRPAPDTMAQLTTLLPAAQGVAVWATLTGAADTRIAAGDPRTRAQIMADTLVERITGQTRADAVPTTINLVVSDQTLLAGGHEPATPPPDNSSPSTPPPAPSPRTCGCSSTSATKPAATPTATPPSATTTTPSRTPPADPPPQPTAKGSANTATTPKKHPAGAPDPSPDHPPAPPPSRPPPLPDTPSGPPPHPYRHPADYAYAAAASTTSGNDSSTPLPEPDRAGAGA